MLWDTHDLQRVKTHGFGFETTVGKEAVSEAPCSRGSDNAADGGFSQAAGAPAIRPPPRHTLPADVWDYGRLAWKLNRPTW